jgi:hypothetical protein
MACTTSGFFLPQTTASSLLIWAKALALEARRASATTRRRSWKEGGERMVVVLMSFDGGKMSFGIDGRLLGREELEKIDGRVECWNSSGGTLWRLSIG